MTVKNYIDMARNSESVPDEKFEEHIRAARKCDKECRINSFVQHSEMMMGKHKKIASIDPTM